MDFLSYLYGRSWRLLLTSIVASLIAGASGVALIALITQAHPGTTNVLAALFFGVCTLHVFARTTTQIILLRLTQGSVLDIRLDMSRKLLAARLTHLDRQGKSELLTILTRDIESLVSAMIIIPMVMTHIAILLGCVAYMAWLAWEMCLVFLAALALGIFTYLSFKRPVLRRLGALRNDLGQLYKHFHDLVEGRRELQLDARRGQRFIRDVLQPDAEKIKSSYISTYSRLAFITNFGDILFYLVIGGILFIVPHFIGYGTTVFTAFAMIVLYLIGLLSTAMNAIPIIVEGIVAFRQLDKLDAALCDDALAEQVKKNPFADQNFSCLTLKGVSHHYPGDRPEERFLLGPVDLRIKAGEILFIVGGNGSGKTTLAMLLLGLYEPEHGTIHLNKTLVTGSNLQHYRHYFCAIFADFHLFRHLLLEPAEDTRVRAEHYLNKLGLRHKVNIIDGQFSTVDLSSGQRKRLALVSAYLQDRDVYLFDEWAADQDPIFKRVFYTELLPELRVQGKTVVVISHDDAYFALGDRVVQLQEGRLVEHSTSTQRA